MMKTLPCMLVLFATACGDPAPLPPALPDATPSELVTPPKEDAESAPVASSTSASEPALDPSATPSASSTASGTTADGAIDEIVFRFHDASVPPPHHRSYTLSATPKRIRRVVDSYGDILSDKQAPLSRADFDALLAVVKKSGLKMVPDSLSESCTGGTARSFKLLSAGKPLLEGRLERCGGEDHGNLVGDLDAMQKALSAKAPSELGP